MRVRKDGRVVPRVGDPGAPYWLGRRPALTIVVSSLVLAGVVVVAGFVVWQDLTSGIPTRVIGTIGGLALGGVAVPVTVWAGWRRLLRPLRRAAAQVKVDRPTSRVIGGRLPLLGGVEPTSFVAMVDALTTPNHWVVLAIDDTAVTILDSSQPPKVLLQLPWREVLRVAPVEYVESGRAYDGLAIDGPTVEQSVVLQVVRPRLMGARFPHGKELDLLAEEIKALRPLGRGA